MWAGLKHRSDGSVQASFRHDWQFAIDRQSQSGNGDRGNTSTGPRSTEGKARSARNAYAGARRAEVRDMIRTLNAVLNAQRTSLPAETARSESFLGVGFRVGAGQTKRKALRVAFVCGPT